MKPLYSYLTGVWGLNFLEFYSKKITAGKLSCNKRNPSSAKVQIPVRLHILGVWSVPCL